MNPFAHSHHKLIKVVDDTVFDFIFSRFSPTELECGDYICQNLLKEILYEVTCTRRSRDKTARTTASNFRAKATFALFFL